MADNYSNDEDEEYETQAYWEIGPDLEPTDIARKMNSYSYRDGSGKGKQKQDGEPSFAAKSGLSRWNHRGRRELSKSVSFVDGDGTGGIGPLSANLNMSKRKSVTKPPVKTRKDAKESKPSWNNTIQDHTKYKRTQTEQQLKNYYYRGQSPMAVSRTIRSHIPNDTIDNTASNSTVYNTTANNTVSNSTINTVIDSSSTTAPIIASNETIWSEQSQTQVDDFRKLDMSGSYDATLMNSQQQTFRDDDEDVRKRMEQLETSRKVFDSKRQRYQDVTRWTFEITLGRPGVTVEMTEEALKQLMDCAGTSNPAREDIMKANTVPKLLVLLKTNSVALQSLAIGVLGNLLDGSNKCRNHVLDHGTVPKLIAAMNSRNERVLENTLGALRNLSVGSDRIKSEMINEGVLSKLIPFLASPNLCLQEEAAGTLKNLAAGSIDLVEIMMQTQVPIVLSRMLLTDDDGVREQVEGALYNLGRSHVVKHIIEMVGSLKSQTKDAHAETESLVQLQKERNAEVVELKAKLFDIESKDDQTVGDFKTKIAELEQHMTHIAEEKNSIENQASIVQQAFKDTCEELNDLKTELGTANEQLERKDNEIQALKSEMVEMKQVFTFEMSEAATNLEAQVADVKKDQNEQLLEVKAQMLQTQQTLEAWRNERELLTSKKDMSVSVSQLDLTQDPPIFDIHNHLNNSTINSLSHSGHGHSSSHGDLNASQLNKSRKQDSATKQKLNSIRTKTSVAFGSSTPRGISSAFRRSNGNSNSTNTNTNTNNASRSSGRGSNPPPPSSTRTSSSSSIKQTNPTIASSKRRRFKQVPGFGLVSRSGNASPHTVGSVSVNDSVEEMQRYNNSVSPSNTIIVGSIPGSPSGLEGPDFNSTAVRETSLPHHYGLGGDNLEDQTSPQPFNTSIMGASSSLIRPVIQRQSTFSHNDESVSDPPRFSLDNSNISADQNGNSSIASFFSSTLYVDKSKHTFG